MDISHGKTIREVSERTDNWLPGNCSLKATRDGRIFFINDEVSGTTWLNPETGDASNTGFYQTKDLPPGWEKAFTPEGASYFVNHNERFTTFYHPITGRIPEENEDFILVDMSDEGETDPLSETYKRPPPASSTGSSGENVQVSESRLVKAPIGRNHKSPVIKYGWLHKQDSSGMKLWKRRWFVLSDDSLFYYKGSQEDNTQRCITLHEYRVAPVEAHDHVSRKYTFKVENPGQRTYYLSAENQREMSDWLSVLSRTARNAPCSPRSSHTNMNKRSDTLLKDHGSQNGANDAKVTRGMTAVSRWPLQNGHSSAGFTSVDRAEDRVGQNSGALRVDGTERFYGDWHRDGETSKMARDGLRKDGLRKASFSLSDLNGISNQRPTQHQQLQPSHHTTPRQDRRFDTRGAINHPLSNLETSSHARPPRMSKTRTLVANTVSLPKQKIELRPQADQQLPSPVSASPPPLVAPPTILGQPYLHCSNSGYKYAQDQVLQQKMNNKDKQQMREGTVWQLFEWQQRHKFRYGIIAGSGSGQDGALLRTATLPNVRHVAPRQGKPHSISIPPSPLDLPPPSASDGHRSVQPGSLSLRARSSHTLTDREPMTGSNMLGMRSNPEERRRPQSLGGKWGNSKQPLVRSSSMSDKAHSVRSDGNSFLMEEQDIEFKLSRLCEEEQLFCVLSSELDHLYADKVRLEDALARSRQQQLHFLAEPVHSERIGFQQHLLQDDLVQLRARLSQALTVGKMSASMLASCVGVATHPGLCPVAKETAEAAPTLCTEYGPNGWMGSLGMCVLVLSFGFVFACLQEVEKVNASQQELKQQAYTTRDKLAAQLECLSLEQGSADSKEQDQLRRVLWRVEDVLCGLSAHSGMERAPHATEPSKELAVSNSSHTSSLTANSNLGSLHHEETAPPRPPLPNIYDLDCSLSPALGIDDGEHLVRDSMARPATVRELKRQSGGRRRDRDYGALSDGDLAIQTIELRPSRSESELIDLPDLRFNTRSQSVRHGTGFSSHSAELPFRHKAATVPSYATLRHSHVDLRDSRSEQQLSALERLYTAVLPHHSAEEQLKQMKERQRSLKRQRKRSLGTASASQSPVTRAHDLPPLPKPNSNTLASRLPPVPNHHHDAPVQQPSYHNLPPRPTDPGERWRRDDADIRMLEHAVRSDGDDADHNETWSTANQEEKQMTYDEVEPDYFNLNLTKELVPPDMVQIPERYVESEADEPASPQELEARRRAVARIHNILTRSSVQNVMQQEDLLQSNVDQERKISMSYELAAEASRRGKAVAARGSTLPRSFSRSSR